MGQFVPSADTNRRADASVFIFPSLFPFDEDYGGAEMEKETVTLEKPVILGQITIVAVSRLRLISRNYRCCRTFSGSKAPVAVVVTADSGITVYRASGQNITLEQLIQETPSVKDSLEKLCHS
jgi:hypothetical protein